MTETVLITGAAGIIGSKLRYALARPDRVLRLLDVAVQNELAPDERAEIVVGSFVDAAVIDHACEDVDVVVHLGGLSTGGFTWDEYLNINVNGTYAVLEAARKAGVPRMIFASSNHAAGFAPIDNGVVADYTFPRPDSYYGVSKVASESLCSLYYDRYGIDAICLRIGSYRERPTDRRALWSWLSPGDCVRLFEAAIATPQPGFRVVWGVSANSRGVVSLEEGRAIGYIPLDDAEAYAEEINALPVPDDATTSSVIGGPYAAPTFE